MGGAHDQMSMSCVSDQVYSKPIRWALQHTKCLTKDQVAHDVEHHPVTPVCNIPRIAPAVLLASTRGSISLLSQQPTCRPDVRQNVPLQALDRTVAERMAHYAPLPCVLHLVDAAVNIYRGFARRKRRVEIGLADIRTETVD